jgi:monothiol glutaredoxin
LSPSQDIQDREQIQDQIREAVDKTPVLLFMKGTPLEPQCGFSARVVQVLERHGVPYKSVDVLADPALREGIKHFASWPTVPQLYVLGEFVGGCDIVLEMDGTGELEEILRAADQD